MCSSDEVLKKRFAHESEYNGHREKGVFGAGAVHGYRDALKQVKAMLVERERVIQQVIPQIPEPGEREHYIMRYAEVARLLQEMEEI